MSQRRNELSGGALARSWLVVDDVIARAATNGERAVSVGRLILALIILVAWPIATWSGLRDGQIANLMVIGLALFAALFSGAMLWHLRAHPTRPVLSLASCAVDAGFVLLLLSSYVMWPADAYLGFGRMSGVATAYLALLAAGIRLSRRAVLVSLALLLPGIVALMAIDEVKNGIDDTFANRITIVVVLLTAAILAWLIATRTKSLVLEGAREAVAGERARTVLEQEVRSLNAHLRKDVTEHSERLSNAIEALAQQREANSSFVGTVIDGRFEIVRHLGSGGMGAVYEGKELTSGARVAIKMVGTNLDRNADALARFVREAKAAAAIDHAAVVRVLGIDISEDGRLFQVLEHVDGISLDDKLTAELLTAPVAARAGSILCSALAAAHAAGVIHRDVKPANIMLTSAPPGLKLLDFGVAKLVDPDASGTGTGKHIGTPAYMAPEQLGRDGDITDRVDCFAVGLVLYRMVTGALPPRSRGAAQALEEEGVPADFASIVVPCLADDPGARPTAADLARRLAAFADNASAPTLPDWATRSSSGETSRFLRELVRSPDEQSTRR